MAVSNALTDSLLADYKKPEDPVGGHGLPEQLTKKLVGGARPGSRDGRTPWPRRA